MKKFTFLFLLIPHLLYSQTQGINNIWLMGYGSQWGLPWGINHVDFISGSPTITYDSLPMEFNHTHANISDSLGNILFYTNGYYIADASDDTMQNGSGISPGAYANFAPDGFLIPQGALIIQKPGSSNLYYLFHSSCDHYPMSGCRAYQLYVTTIDMNLNAGLGAVVSKNVSVIVDTLNTGKITACRHGNGRDWWVFVHRVNSNMFYKLLITPGGIQGPYTQNIGLFRMWDAGQAKFSPDGSRFAYYHYFNGLDIFDFDRCTGLFSNPENDTTLPWIVGNVGCAFSPNSDVLYVSNILKIYQYDLTVANIQASRTEVAVYDSFVDPQNSFGTYLCYPELAPDGKIYITTGNSTQFMHVINYPDSLGSTCNVMQHGIFLSSLYFNTLPNHPNYFLQQWVGSPCDSLGIGIESPPAPKGAVKVSPNPSNGVFTLSFPVQKIAGQLEVYDVMGNLVYKDYVAQWSQYKRIDIGYLSTGIYFCKIRWREKEGNVKIIKE